VHAFEPIPKLQGLIREAIERNGIENVRLHDFALGAKDEDLTLSVPRDNAGASSFVAARHTADSASISVKVRTLSSTMIDLGVTRIRLVKIDVEGFEPEVLEGATEFFVRQPPDVVLFELNDASDPHSHPTILTLSDLGYGFFSLPKKLTRMSATRFSPLNMSDTPSSHDFVAARLGKIYEEVALCLRAK
jgi:FkbM family methyltransferase